MERIQNTPVRDCWFVALVALAFWTWLGKDLVFNIIQVNLPTGKLITIVVFVLILLFVAGRPKSTPNERAIRALRLKSLIAVMLFLGYCSLHVVIWGHGYSVLKLQQLAISIVIAYALSYKTIRAIDMNKTLFFIVGLLFGLAAYYTVFFDIKAVMAMETGIGLRAKRMAHLNIQDCYVVLFLYATTLLFSGRFRLSHLAMFVGTAALCVPIVIGMNSRMIPFTIGITFIYMTVSLRSVLVAHGNRMRNILLFLIVVIGGLIFVGDLIHPDSRLMRIFNEGILQSFSQGPRYVSFNKALMDFGGSPVYGVGFGRFAVYGEYGSGVWAHNMFLELLSELGIIGLLVFAYSVVRTLIKVLFVRFKSNQEFLVFPCLLLIYTAATMQLTHNLIHPLLWVGYFCCDAAFQYDRYASSGQAGTLNMNFHNP